MTTFPSPPHIRLPHPALCLSSHPATPTLAIGLAASGIVVSALPHLSDPSSVIPPATVTHSLDNACHAVAFIPGTSHLIASAGSVQLFDVTKRAALHSYTLPSPSDGASPSATTFTPLDAHVALVGDDSGGIHLLDLRAPDAPCASVLQQADYITQLTPVDRFGTRAILSASGDGTLCAYDLRRPPHARLRLQYACDSFNDDVLSLGVLADSPVAVGGTLSGALNLYNLRFLDRDGDPEAGAHVDRFYGHPECVNAVLAWTEGVALTASSDGIVRVVDVVGKALLGVLDYVPEEFGGKRKAKAEAWPIEGMTCLHGMAKPCFALLGHDDMIRFCDGSSLADEEKREKEAEDDVGSEEAKQESRPAEPVLDQQSTRKKKKKKKRNTFESERKPVASDDFFNDL